MALTGMLAVIEKEREFDYTERDFARIRQLIHEHAGISLSDKKRDMVYSRIARRLRVHRLTRFADYLALLERDHANEWEQFVNALTTNLTSFFREPHHFPVLAELARKRPQGVTVWCAAASTGEEPYSIAMTLADVYGTSAAAVRIIASDLDTQVLARARDGIYPLDRVEHLPATQLRRHFQRGRGSNDGLARVRPELRRMIEFSQINLLGPKWPVSGPLDAIFCRNVMIYFDKPTQRRILERFTPMLAPHGLLFAGHSENFHNAHDLFRMRGKTIYEPVRLQGRYQHAQGL
jgi:chemotaxis protein methyltransferase CheR